MTKVMIINGVWSTILCSMVALGTLLCSAQASDLHARQSLAYDYTASDIE